MESCEVVVEVELAPDGTLIFVDTLRLPSAGCLPEFVVTTTIKRERR